MTLRHRAKPGGNRKAFASATPVDAARLRELRSTGESFTVELLRTATTSSRTTAGPAASTPCPVAEPHRRDHRHGRTTRRRPDGERASRPARPGDRAAGRCLTDFHFTEFVAREGALGLGTGKPPAGAAPLAGLYRQQGTSGPSPAHDRADGARAPTVTSPPQRPPDTTAR